MIDYINFLKHPSWTGSYSRPAAIDFFALFFIYMLIMMPISVLLHFLTNILDLSTSINHMNLSSRIIRGILLAPLVEEIFFRLLYVFSRRNLWVVIGTALILVVIFIIKTNYQKTVVFISVALVMGSALLSYKTSNKFIKTHFRLFFYFLALAFAGMHLTNFQGITMLKFLPALMLVIPQFILATMLGFVRLRYGFIYAVLFHATVNSTLLLTFWH